MVEVAARTGGPPDASENVVNHLKGAVFRAGNAASGSDRARSLKVSFRIPTQQALKELE